MDLCVLCKIYRSKVIDLLVECILNKYSSYKQSGLGLSLIEQSFIEHTSAGCMLMFHTVFGGVILRCRYTVFYNVCICTY